MENISIHEKSVRLLSVEKINLRKDKTLVISGSKVDKIGRETYPGEDEDLLKRKLKKYRKLLNASPQFRTKNEVVIYKSRSRVSAIAVWKNTVLLYDGFQIAKFARINVYYYGAKYRYAIPLNLVEKRPSFPELSLTKEEVQVLYAMADEISIETKGRESRKKVPRQEQEDVVTLSRQSKMLGSDKALVADIFKKNPWALFVAVEALLANLRPWIDKKALPIHVVAFVGNSNCLPVVKSTLNACNFTSNQLLEFKLILKTDLEHWKKLGCRMSLLSLQEKAKTALLEEAESIAANRTLSVTEDPFVAQPFIWLGQKEQRTVVENIDVSEALNPLSEKELDMLRAFLGELLKYPDRRARKAMKLYGRRFKRATYYRETPMEAWRSVGLSLIHKSLGDHGEIVHTLVENEKIEDNAREISIENAVDLVLDYGRYQEKILKEWTETGKELGERLNEAKSHVALRREISNEDCLLFTYTSLKAFTGESGLDVSDFEAFYVILEKEDVFRTVNKKIVKKASINGSTVNCLQLRVERCDSLLKERREKSGNMDEVSEPIETKKPQKPMN